MQIIKKICFITGLVFAALIILLASLFYALPLATPYLQAHRAKLEQKLGHLIHYPIKVGTISVGRSGINPEFKIHDVNIYQAGNSKQLEAHFDDMYIGVNIIASITARRLVPDLIVLSGARFNLYQGQGMHLHGDKKASTKVNAILADLLAPKQVDLRSVYVVWHTKSKQKIICPNLQLQIINNLSTHQVIGTGDLLHKHRAKFKLVVKLADYSAEDKGVKADGFAKITEPGKVALNLWFDWQDGKLNQLQSQFMLRDMELQPGAESKLFHIDSLAGNVLLQHKKDAWNLSGNYSNIKGSYGKLFREPLAFSRLQAIASWQHQSDGWHILADQVMLQNSDLALYGKAALLLPADHKSPVVDAMATLQLTNIPHVHLYYPAAIMPPNVVAWLDSAITRGKAIDATVVLRGPLKQFPFADHSGKFEVAAQLHNIELNFDPAWPVITNINGKIFFVNAGMDINAAGSMLNLASKNIEVKIADLTQPLLTATADIKGDNANLVKLINQSPLQESLGAYFQGVTASGPVASHFKLQLPLGQTPGKFATDGTITEQGGELKMLSNLVTLDHIQGKLHFTADSLRAKNIKARAFGAPVNININTLGNLVAINANGKANMTAVKQQFSSPWLSDLQGGFNYQAKFKLYKDAKSVNDFTFISNLQGLEIALPAPLAKNAAEIKSLYARATFAANKPMLLRVRYNHAASAALKFGRKSGQSDFIGGAINFGTGGLATVPGTAGLLITGYLPELTWSDWQPYLVSNKKSNNATAKKAKKQPPLLHKLDLKIGKLYVFDQILANAELQVEPKPGSWLAHISSDPIVGQLSVPDDFPNRTLHAKFDKLYLRSNKNKSKAMHKKSPKFLPGDIPPLALTSRDFRYNGTQYGKVELELIPHGNNLRISKLAIHAPLYTLIVSGEWQLLAPGKEKSSLYGNLQTNNLGGVLQAWTGSNNIDKGVGNMTFTVHWLDSIYKPGLATMQGNFLLDFKKGSIVNLDKDTEEKINIGRVLNILSLQSIPDRLSGNLSGKGFHFKEIKGNLSLADGSIYTSGTHMNGAVARVGVSGRIGVTKQDYNLLLTVLPNLTSSLPVIATIIGGPVVGAVTWAGDEVFKHTLQPATMTYKYKVTGSWKDPHIVKLVANQQPVVSGKPRGQP
ncbi:MAG: TIGR02099 family protein [Gammaproteobacteria bacterium]|nr:TIGR02099 family protein [Gammaproteobacteria bacterium]